MVKRRQTGILAKSITANFAGRLFAQRLGGANRKSKMPDLFMMMICPRILDAVRVEQWAIKEAKLTSVEY